MINECRKVGNHPNIVRLMGVCLDEEQTSIVSQFYAQGSCYKVFLRDRRNVPWKDLLKVVKGAAAGILHLHAENYIHRDIASRNILISDSFEGIVTDFGMSRLQLRDGSQSITYLGPVKWMAPESIRDRIISKATDVYMFGSFMWELIMRDIPYADEDPFAAALKVINQGCSLTMPEDCHPGYLSLMEACLKTAPEERPSFVEILMRLEELYEEAETNLSLTYAKPSTTGLILAQKAAPKSGYVDSSPVFDLGTLKLESSPSPFKPESKLNKSLNSSGSSKSSATGYMDAMPTATGYMDAMPRSDSPLGAPNTRTSLGVPARQKSTPVNPDGYLSVMPTIAINANGYIFTTSDISNAGSSSSRDTGSSSPTGNSSPTSSDRTSRDESHVKTSATSAPRSIPSPGRPKSMAGGSVSPSNGTPSAISKFQPGSLDSALGSSSYSSSLPAGSPSSTTPTAPSIVSGRANSLKISTSSSPSPTTTTHTTNTPPLSPTHGPRRMSASSSSTAGTGAGSGPRSIPHSITSTGASSAPNIGARTKDQSGSISPSASSPSVSTNTRFGNTCDTPLRSNITLYSTRVIPSSELLGWKPQFHMEHTFKRSRMSSSAPSRGSPVHMGQSGGIYPPENNNGNNGNTNNGSNMPHSPQTHYGGNHGHSGLSVSMGAPSSSPYTMRSSHAQQQPMQASHGHHAPSYQPPSGSGLSASQGRTPLNNSSGNSSGSIGYHTPHGIMYAPSPNAPTPHMQPQGYKTPMQVNNQPQNPFSHGGMGFQPVHAMVHNGGANNYPTPTTHQHPGHSVSPTQQPSNSYSVPQNQQNNKQGLSQSAKSKSPTSPQIAQQSPQQAPVQQPTSNVAPMKSSQQIMHTSGYQPQQPLQSSYGAVPQYPYPPTHATNYGPPQYYAQPYHSPQSSHPPSSVTSSTYTKPLPTLPQPSFTSSTYPKPLPAIPESNSRKSYAPSHY